MNVLIDSLAFDLQLRGGVSRYNYELINGLTEKGVSVKIPFSHTNNIYLNKLKKHESQNSWTQKLIKQNWTRNLWLKTSMFKSSYLRNLKETIEVLEMQKYDIFHPSYYSTYFLPYLGSRPFVITIHDMTHELYPQYFKKYDDTIKVKKKLCNEANHIIAISENTKIDLHRINNIPLNKISVVHHASSLKKKKKLQNNTSEYPNVLYIGSRNGYKNFWFMLKAIKNVIKKENIKLYCIGSPFSSFEIARLKEMKIDHIIETIACSDEELYAYYQNAICLIYPSLYEGFGLPILEAMSCGCPVICSDRSSLPEVGGESVIYFNPTDENEIKNSLTRIIINKKLRSQLRTKGLNRSLKFNWNKCCEETLEIYKRVI